MRAQPILLGLALVVSLSILLGLSFGFYVARLDETRVINKVAADHVAAGGRAEDCVARPGRDPVWLVVICGSGPGARARAFNRFGFEVVDARAPEA